MSRRERIAVAVGAGLYLLLRLILVHQQGAVLLHSEELFNLRLVNQVDQGLPVGPLGEYWYGQVVAGGGGGGGLVVSALYVPLSLVAGTGHAVMRLQGLLWALLTLGSAAWIGRQLLGRGGAAAATAAMVVAPPAFLGWSMLVLGNYSEGAALAMLGLAFAATPLPVGPRARWLLPPALGLVTGFGAWFVPMYAPMGLLALIVAALRWRRSAALGVAVAAALVGVSPWLLLADQAPSSGMGGGVTMDLGPGLAHLFGVVPRALASVSISPQHPWPGPEVAPWPQGLVPDAALRGLGWLASGALVVWGAVRLRRPTEGGRALAALALGCGLASIVLPIGVSVMGLGPTTLNELGVPRMRKFDARRFVLVQPLQALGLAVMLSELARLERARWVAWGVAGLLLLLPLTRVVGTVAEGGSLGVPLALERTAFVPELQPRQWKEYVSEFRYPDEHVSLGAIGSDPRADDLTALRAAIVAYMSVEGGQDGCHGDPEAALTDAEGLTGALVDDVIRRFAWQSAARAVEDKCGHLAVEPFCGGAPDNATWEACLDGGQQSYEDPHPADFYEEPDEREE